MLLPPDYVLFAGVNCPEHIEDAKEYIRRNELTSDDVKMMASEKSLLIVSKKEVALKS